MLALRSTVVRLAALCLLAAAATAGLGACTHAGGKVPVDSPVYAFQPADPDDYATDSDTDDSGDDSSDDGGSDSDSGE